MSDSYPSHGIDPIEERPREKCNHDFYHCSQCCDADHEAMYRTMKTLQKERDDANTIASDAKFEIDRLVGLVGELRGAIRDLLAVEGRQPESANEYIKRQNALDRAKAALGPEEKEPVGIEMRHTPDVFMNWFRSNYPGPNTIISNPDWHAPKIYRTALALSAHDDLLVALKALLPEGWDDGTMDHMPGVRQARLAIGKAEAS